MKKNLKIGIFIDQLVPGGVQKSAIREALELKKLGHEVTLYVLVRLSYSYQYHDLTEGFKVIYLSDYNPWPFKYPIRIPYFAFLTHLHILNSFFTRRYKFLKKLDFIISHGTTTCITVAAISRKLKIPYMAFIWDPMIYILEKVYGGAPTKYLFPILKLIVKFYERSFLVSAALVATSSRVHQKFIEDVYQISPQIIYPGCFTSKNIPKNSGTYTLGYTRWELAKNPMIFLSLAKKLPKIKFLIAGSWTNPKEEVFFKDSIKKRGLEKQFEFISPITAKDLSKIASKSLVWLHTNFEAFGMAGLEMAALGLPIIIPKGSGVTELFIAGKHGFFPEINAEKEYLTYLKKIINNKRLAYEMGQSTALVARNYTWTRHAEVLANSISEYISQTKILCIANAFVATHSTGGGDQFILELVKRIPKSFHLTIILPFTGYYHFIKAGILKPNIRYLVLPSNRFDNIDEPISLFFTYIIRSIQTFFLIQKLPEFKIIYTSTDLTPDSLPAFLIHKLNPKVPWVTRFFHFVEPPLKRAGKLWINIGSYYLQQISLKLISKSTKIMVDNPVLKAELKKKGTNTKIIDLQQGGVDYNLIASAKFNQKHVSDAVFVGRLQHHKGIFDAIEIWSQVVKVKPKSKLVIIGYASAEVLKQLKSLIKEKQIEKNVHFAGYINDKNLIASYYKSTKMFLFLDHEAGFGLVVAEAMAAGLPVIAYNLSIFGTVYKKGFLVSPVKDFEGVRKNILSILTQNRKRTILSKKSAIEAKKFDWTIASRKFYEAFENLSK